MSDENKTEQPIETTLKVSAIKQAMDGASVKDAGLVETLLWELRKSRRGKVVFGDEGAVKLSSATV